MVMEKKSKPKLGQIDDSSKDEFCPYLIAAEKTKHQKQIVFPQGSGR